MVCRVTYSGRSCSSQLPFQRRWFSSQFHLCLFNPKVVFLLLSGSAVLTLLFSVGHGKLQGNKNSLGRRLFGLLSSGVDGRKVEELDNPHEILKMLIDLVSILLNCSPWALMGANVTVSLHTLPCSLLINDFIFFLF